MTRSAHLFLCLAWAAASATAYGAELVSKTDIVKDNDGRPSTAQAVCKSLTNEVRPNVVSARPDGGSVLCRIGDGKPDDDSEQHSGLVEKGCQLNAREAGASQCQCDPGFKAANGQCINAASHDEAPPAIATPTPEIIERVRPEGSLTQMANEVKALGQQRGATVEIVLAKLPNGRQILVAGINSGSRGWTKAQRAQLAAWGVNIAPDSIPKAQLNKADGGALHAEENMGAFLQKIGARGERWSKAVVGETKPGGSSYVCKGCQGIIASVGGRVEEPAPKAPAPPLDKPLRPPGK